MREEKTALKSCSSPLALLSFPKLLTPFAFSRKGSPSSHAINHKGGKMRQHFSRVKDCVLVAVQRRNAGRAAHGTLYKKARGENRFEKLFFSPRAPLFP